MLPKLGSLLAPAGELPISCTGKTEGLHLIEDWVGKVVQP